MSETTTLTRYNSVSVFIHWLTAIAIIGMLALGWIMTNISSPLKFSLFQWHKSIGITILLLSLFRLVWRLTHKIPALPTAMPQWEKIAARGAHWLFYALIIGMPLTGWVMVSTAKHNFPTILYYFIPWPQLPVLPTLDNKQEINHMFNSLHGYLAYGMAGLLALHIGAVIKHHFIVRDDVLTNMAPKIFTGALNRIRGIKTTALLVAFAVLAFSQPASAKTWNVDYTKSHISFGGKQEGDAFQGGFKNFQANIDFDPDHPEAGKITATIDIASATAGNAERDGYLPQPAWFDTKKFPQAVFTTTKIEKDPSCNATNQKTGECDIKCFNASGTLTIKGVVKEVTLPFCLKPAGDQTEATGKLTLTRTDFNLGSGQWAGDDLVAHAVNVTIDIMAKAN